MQAIGVGDIDLHSVDNMGNQCVLTLKDVLCIPEANKSLISVSMLAKEGYQCVYLCPDPVLLQGIYQQRKNAKEVLVANTFCFSVSTTCIISVLELIYTMTIVVS